MQVDTVRPTSVNKYNYTPFEEEGVYRIHCVGQSVCRFAGSLILSGLFLTIHWVEFNKILPEASIPRGDVHILKGLQLHDILQSYGPFTN